METQISMKNKKKVLLCFEKYCDLNPDMKLTNSYHNFLNTFSRSCPEYVFHTMHYDESKLVYEKHIDEILPQYCSKWDIKIVIFILLGGSDTNPSLSTYSKLRDMGVYLCFHWPDTGPGWGTETIKSLSGYSDLHISWDNPRSRFHDNFKFPDNHINLWVPQDPTYFYKENVQDIEISFAGSSRYLDRQFFLHHAQKECPELLICGGQREANLSPELYAEVIRKSKIGLNFSLSPANFFQTKGRIFEILASCSMLLEFKNPSTSKLFTPNEDYVEFENERDLVNKIKYYVSHQEERCKIAMSGYKKYMENYTAEHFWKKIMSRIEEEME
jgi:hypothetical protein